MSILIRGMEMPEAGEHVLLLHVYHDGTASIIGDHQHYKNEPFEIVPVPPHGRLIDADGEIGVNVMMMPGMKCRVDLIAPTVIPAEESGLARIAT